MSTASEVQPNNSSDPSDPSDPSDHAANAQKDAYSLLKKEYEILFLGYIEENCFDFENLDKEIPELAALFDKYSYNGDDKLEYVIPRLEKINEGLRKIIHDYSELFTYYTYPAENSDDDIEYESFSDDDEDQESFSDDYIDYIEYESDADE
jgi:hypothetical protein